MQRARDCVFTQECVGKQEGGKRGRFQEDGEEGKKTGKISLPETGKMDMGKQQKGEDWGKRGRFARKEKIGSPIHRYSTTEVTGSRSTTAPGSLTGQSATGYLAHTLYPEGATVHSPNPTQVKLGMSSICLPSGNKLLSSNNVSRDKIIWPIAHSTPQQERYNA